MEFMLNNVFGDSIYSGLHSYHSHNASGMNVMAAGGTRRCPYWVGVELEVECNRESLRDWLAERTSNWFYLETDGSLNNYGAEIITIRMNPHVAYNPETWATLVEELSDRGATSHNNGRCGLHVHISRTGLGFTEDEQDETMTKILHLYHNELERRTSYLNLCFRRNYESYCRTSMSDISSEKSAFIRYAAEAGFSAFTSSFRKKALKGMSKGGERYTSINRINPDTIEFRQGRGTLKATSIAVTVEFVCAIVDFCRKTPFDKCTSSNFTAYVKKLKKSSELRRLLITSSER
jgi:hypothetical protein